VGGKGLFAWDAAGTVSRRRQYLDTMRGECGDESCHCLRPHPARRLAGHILDRGDGVPRYARVLNEVASGPIKEAASGAKAMGSQRVHAAERNPTMWP